MSASRLFPRMAAAAVLSIVSGFTFAASHDATAASESSATPKWKLRVTPMRIDEASIQKVQQGMTQDQVTSIVGAPNRMEAFARSMTVAWDYDYVDAWGYQSVFSVIFDQANLVVSKISVRRRY